MNHPVLILIRGLPGSGKSYLATALQKQIGEEGSVLLDPDAVDFDKEDYKIHSAAQLAEGVDPKLLPYRFLRSKAYLGIEDNKIIIWNQPFTDLDIFDKMVARLKTHAYKHSKKLSILVVEVNVDHEIAKDRVDKRKKTGGHGPSDKTFTRFASEYSSAASRGYQVVSVNGQAEVQQSTNKILTELKQFAVL